MKKHTEVLIITLCILVSGLLGLIIAIFIPVDNRYATLIIDSTTTLVGTILGYYIGVGKKT